MPHAVMLKWSRSSSVRVHRRHDHCGACNQPLKCAAAGDGIFPPLFVCAHAPLHSAAHFGEFGSAQLAAGSNASLAVSRKRCVPCGTVCVCVCTCRSCVGQQLAAYARLALQQRPHCAWARDGCIIVISCVILDILRPLSDSDALTHNNNIYCVLYFTDRV